MNPHSSAPVPPRLEPVLRRLRTRIRRLLSTRGALVTAVTALAILLGLVILDAAFSPLPAVVRWFFPILWLGGTAYAAFTAWWLPLRRPLDLIRIARWLETRHPEFDERISTVLEVSGHSDSGMSAQLLGQLAKDAARSLECVDPRTEVSTRRTRHWLWPAAALLAIWGILFAIWPDPTARHIVRALVPTSKLGNAAGRIVVTPGSIEVIEGDTLEITARHSAGAAVPLELVVFLPDGSRTEMPMTAGVYQLGRADLSFEYQVRRGRETSDRYQVTVWPKPRLVDPRVRLEFPAYTGIAAREQALGDAITAIVGTKVEVTAKLNTPVKSARLEIDQETIGSTALESAADGGRLNTGWALEKAGRSTGRLVLDHQLGREFEAAVFTIESQPDNPPGAKWLAVSDKPLRLRPNDLLKTGYEVTDDVGLGAVALEVEPERGDSARLPVDAPPRFGSVEPPVWRGRIHQPVGELTRRWPESRSFKLRIRAEDSRPENLGGPGVGTSGWLVVRIDDNAESLARQDIFSAHSDARESLDEARELVSKAQERINRHAHEIRNDQATENTRKELTKAREELADARETLEELADRMDESVHADKADDVRAVAQTVDAARQQLENAPLQDTPEERGKATDSAREQAEQAKRQIDELKHEIQRDEPQLQDYAQLKELEQQQRELARQAASDEELSAEWQQQQQQVADALHQDLQQQPQAKAAALEQQAQQARELANEARQQAAGQDALEQTAENPDALRDQLAEEQAEIAAEAKQQLAAAHERQDQPTANALPEAVAATENAAKALAEGNTETAGEEAAKAAQQLAEVSETAAGLSDLAERQENVAAALAALEQGNAAEAAATLSEMKAEQAAQLAEDIGNTPQVNGPSGAMQQAAQASKQGAESAKQAAHAQAADQLEQSATHLDQAAAELAQQAAAEAGRQTPDNQAPTPAEPLADAFQQASEAAGADAQPAAASHSQAAAAALAQAADGTLRAMQGQSPSRQPGPIAQAGQSEEADASLRFAEPDPGVPPELAKLGISASDWEKIKASLKSDAGGSSVVALPEEYRDLVGKYFETISKGAP
jgi:hypothetical protein